MDEKIRELERKATYGDREAQEELQRIRVRAGAPEIKNISALWLKTKETTWRYVALGYATYAYVTGPLSKYSKDIEPLQETKKWKWRVGVIVGMGFDEKNSCLTQGYATTFDGAKRIVEVICHETGTCMPR